MSETGDDSGVRRRGAVLPWRRLPESDAVRIWLWVPAFLACLVGFGIVTLDRHGSEGFGDLPQFYVWAVLIAIQTAIWVLVAAQSWGVLAGLRSRFGEAASGRMPVLSWAVLVVVLGILGLLVRAPKVGSPLRWHQERVLLLTGLGALAATPAVVGIWRLQLVVSRDISARVRAIEPGSGWSSAHQDVWARISDVRLRLQRFLGALGAIVAGLTLTSGALRNAVVAWKATRPAPARAASYEFPLEYVVIYGLFFTALVALVYLPVYGTLERTGMDFVDAVFPLPAEQPPSGDWQAGRERLSKLLQLGFRAEDSLRSGIAIFAPLLATLVSTLLPGAK